MNKLRSWVFAGNMAGLVFCGVFLNQLFALEGMSTICVVLFVMFSFAAESFFRYLSLLVDYARRLIKRIRGEASRK